MNYCKNPNCEPCRLMRDSERNANNKIRELQREARYVDQISERAREKQREINQQIREVEWETTELKRDIARVAMEQEKEIRRQARERRQQALSALTKQELREVNRQARERLLPALLEEVRQRCEQAQAAAQLVSDPETVEDFRLQTRERIQQLRSSQDQYPRPNQSIPTTLYPCCPDCGSASTSALRPLTTYPETPRLPSRPRFANVQQQRPPHPSTSSGITSSSFCRCPACLRTQEMITRSSGNPENKEYLRRLLNIPRPEEEELKAGTPTCSGAVSEEEDVWEKYVRDDPKARKESPSKRVRYPKRVRIVSQDEEEGESEEEIPMLLEDKEKGALEDGEELVEKSGEKFVVDLKEGRESEEESEDQDQVGDNKLSTCSIEEELITLVRSDDAN